LLLAMRLYKEPEKFSGAWNFGPPIENQHSVFEIVQEFIKHYRAGEIDFDHNKNKHEATLLALDITKATKELEWQPVLGFEEISRLTAEWYLNYQHQDVYRLTHKQIKEFSKRWK